MQLLDDPARQIATLENLVLRVVVELWILEVLRLGLRKSGNCGRPFRIDQEAALGLKELEARVPLDQDRRRRQHEYAERDVAIPVDNGEVIEDVNVVARRALGLR